MDTSDLSDFVRMLMDKKGLSLEKVAEQIPISPQGLHNWIHKRKNVNWKIQSLLKLSEILDFDLSISKGNLYVKESIIVNMKNELNNRKKLNSNLEDHVSLSVENKRFDYEVCKEFADYSIVKLYVRNTSVNDDIEPVLLEGWLDCYNTIDECYQVPGIESVIDVFALMDNKTGELIEDCEPSLYIDDIETRYYINYAPTIEKTKEGFEIVGVNHELNIKIAKGYVTGTVINNEFYVKEVHPSYREDCLIGLAVMSIEEESFKKNSVWYSNAKYMYTDIIPGYSYKRYFDKNRNEITERSILVLEGFNSYVDENTYSYFDGKYGSLNNFEEGDTVEVESLGGDLGIYIGNVFYNLNDLPLLKWKLL